MGITPVRSLLVGALIGQSADADPTDTAILAATIRCLSHHGLERTTVADVAAEAGVGRATVFRRFDTKEELLGRAFAWELDQLVTRFHAAIDDIEDPYERAVEWIVEAVRTVRHHPVARRFVDDGAALPLLHDPQITAALLTSVRHELDLTAQRAGITFDTATAAEIVSRFFASVWLAPDLGSATATDDGVRRVARTMLSFLIVPSTPSTDS
ncbi:TetR/AcrR family transcriptional regulator [Rhodococcus sp. C26F]|uniref:TetR/AcrR family transcriptional regulator n=1 Tax=Rhodococcus rhodochrous TaxID=1829 RepID=A0AAW4X976_RHORH|nr:MULTISPECIES: TetR/AcrR family transcriptional regulator [Rhodococcus]MCD2109503.1 TetR/AcrR family transcriptional regulator [Rhodococcus rhodochrous]QHG83747.1 TetR/AcrR family transcriptional regulator [Rhodococcus rhodochrous]WAL48599.1 helix-turn-helix domain containing protein [Rhodococcus pyridinivorans]BDB60475.1 putative TetR-family transcriptional regulator [Rhodococcus sp. RDE2]